MDFASLMSAQIAKAKTSVPAQQSYLKRSEIEANRQATYLAEQEASQRASLARTEKKRKLEDEEASKIAEREEKRARMAEESRMARLEEEQTVERERRKRLGLPDLDAVTVQNTSAQSTSGDDARSEDDESHEPLEGKDLLVPQSLPAEPKAQALVYRQLAAYFSLVLSEWIHALSSRDASTKTSTSGIAATNAMTQARENMVPLFRLLKQRNLPQGIQVSVHEIVRQCQEREYIKANDAYLRLSIGKAAWPIGVTMVGIHERSAREKLHEKDGDQAHILSDEVTRKYLQSIKRCLTFAQTRWPPKDGGWV